ncbi:MAG TPA: amylo-alpha-1,6-glucosidase, partial [Blastocatellia bacterium]|nr:amylo-alpha-1,6-glucosidase [Blastocatellia bacterium]
LIVAGMRSYGFDEEALAVFLGLLEAASFFDEHRLPELFAGFSKREFGVPVTYPVACQPQAWAAASIPYMFTTLLGLIPEAFDHRLRIRHPIIPDFMNEVEIRRLRVGDAEVDLKFERALDTIAVKVLNLEGRLEVVVEL